MVLCPVECLTTSKDVACPNPDFVEKNGTWLLSVIGVGTGVLASLLTFFLKSRCTQISCWGVSCVRDVPPQLESAEVKVVEEKKNGAEPGLDTSSNV